MDWCVGLLVVELDLIRKKSAVDGEIGIQVFSEGIISKMLLTPSRKSK
jgi:hypothetical protein